MKIAAQVCVYTNENLTVEKIENASSSSSRT
jgi:ATP-dependent protease HslVU (ClpYQ) peptidase subunit